MVRLVVGLVWMVMALVEGGEGAVIKHPAEYNSRSRTRQSLDFLRIVQSLATSATNRSDVNLSNDAKGEESGVGRTRDKSHATQAAWLTQSTVHGGVFVDWLVVRDSRRDGGFGFQENASPATGQLWLGEQRARIDQTCLVVRGRDGQLHPQDRSTLANRQDFRHALFYQHLAGSNPLPEWKQISTSVRSSQPLLSNRWGGLIQFASLAPVLATAPHFALSAGDIELSERTAHVAGRQLPILLVTMPLADVWELWVDPQADYRIVRWLKREHGRAIGQIDIRYEAHSPWLPVGWTVTEFDPAGYVLEFLSTQVTSVDYTAEAPVELLAAISADGGLNGSLDSAQPAHRYSLVDTVLTFIDRPLVPWIALSLAAILALGWKHRFVRGIVVCLLVATASVAWVGQLPILESPLRPIYNELSGIWEQARLAIAQQAGAQGADTQQDCVLLEDTQRDCVLLEDTQQDYVLRDSEQRLQLERLSQMLQRSYRLRLGGSLWATCVGRDEADEKARMELLQLAQHDLPSVLASDHNSAVRLSLIAERFQRIDQHLAGSGQSSVYIPPIPISYKMNDPRLESP